MESAEDMVRTVVLNLADGRETSFILPPNQAVVAAFEMFEAGGREITGATDPVQHPHFREHRLGYSCGDWIAYRESRLMEAC